MADAGGTLEILADDEAFPMDVESWCRSFGATLIDLETAGAAHRAIVSVRRSASAAPPIPAVPPVAAAAAAEPPATASPSVIDCRGLECPAPILEIARAAKRRPGAKVTVLADDDAFEMDVGSWCRSSGAELLDLHRDARGFRAEISFPGGAGRTAGARGARTPAPPPIAAAPASAATTEMLDCRGLECPAPLLEVARFAKRAPGTTLEVWADDDAFPLDIESWARSTNATIHSLEALDEGIRARITLPPATASSRTPPPPPPVTLPRESRRPSAPTPVLDLTHHRAEDLEAALVQGCGSLTGTLTIRVADRAATRNLLGWCTRGGHELVALAGEGPMDATVTVRASEPTALALRSEPSSALAVRERRAVLLVLHNDKEALLAALMVANGAASQGMEVTLFFTFWGLNLLRGDAPNAAHPKEKVSWAQRLFKWLMPRGPRRQGLGKLNFGGMGGGMMNRLMREKQIMDLPELLQSAEELDVKFIACTTSMKVMGVTKRELHPYANLQYGGVATFVEESRSAEMSLVF